MQFKRQDRERARATLPANVRAQNKAAQDKTDATYLKLVARETNELKTKWLTLNEYHSDPIRKVLNTLKNTLSTLEKENPAENSSFADSLHQDAWDAVSRGDLEAVEEILRELKSLKVPERYLALLQEASEITEENEQSLPTGEQAADEDKLEEEEAAIKEPAEEIEAKAEKETISKSPSKKPTESSPSASVSSADQDSGTSKVQVIFVVVLIVVIAGALGAAFLGRKKK